LNNIGGHHRNGGPQIQILSHFSSGEREEKGPRISTSILITKTALRGQIGTPISAFFLGTYRTVSVSWAGAIRKWGQGGWVGLEIGPTAGRHSQIILGAVNRAFFSSFKTQQPGGRNKGGSFAQHIYPVRPCIQKGNPRLQLPRSSPNGGGGFLGNGEATNGYVGLIAFRKMEKRLFYAVSSSKKKPGDEYNT